MTEVPKPGAEGDRPAPVPPPDAACAKCGRSDVPLQPDPDIDEVWFCAPCWAERARVTAMHEYGYDNDIMEE